MRYSNKKKNELPKQIKVSSKLSEWICLMIIFMGVEIPCIIAMLNLEKFRLAGFIICIIWLCFTVLYGIFALAFVMHIEGTTIWGRTESGKKFRFDCSDIKRITYRHYNAGYRSRKCTLLIIEIEDMKIVVDSAMSGYKEATEYLLEMQQKGFISQKSISAADAKSIKRENKARKK